MKNRILTLLLSALLPLVFSLSGCQTAASSSDGEGADWIEVQDTGKACICGTPEGDLHGCHCEECLVNGGNPFNPACTCLPLGPQQRLDITLASFGPGGDTRPRSLGGLIGMDELRLRKGGKVVGEVVADDGETVDFRHTSGRVETYTYEQLDHRMVYRLLKGKCIKGDPQDELKLATFARDSGLYAHSRRHYGLALAADPELADEIEVERATLRQLASASELEKAKAAYLEGNDKQARKHLATLVQEFPDEEATQSAGLLLREIQARSMGREQASVARDLEPEVVDQLSKVGKDYEQMLEKNSDGLAAGGRSSQAISDYNAALAAGEKARRELERVRRTGGGDLQLLEGSRAYEQMVDGGLTETYRNLANHYFSNGEHQKALDNVNKALALSPDDEDAKQLRARIQSSYDSYKEGYRKAQQQAAEVRSRRGLYGYYRGRGRVRVGGYGLLGGYYGGLGGVGIGIW